VSYVSPTEASGCFFNIYTDNPLCQDSFAATRIQEPYRVTSITLNAYGMQLESDIPDTYEGSIWKEQPGNEHVLVVDPSAAQDDRPSQTHPYQWAVGTFPIPMATLQGHHNTVSLLPPANGPPVTPTRRSQSRLLLFCRDTLCSSLLPSPDKPSHVLALANTDEDGGEPTVKNDGDTTDETGINNNPDNDNRLRTEKTRDRGAYERDNGDRGDYTSDRGDYTSDRGDHEPALFERFVPDHDALPFLFVWMSGDEEKRDDVPVETATVLDTVPIYTYYF
jgi:hypothetical protein